MGLLLWPRSALSHSCHFVPELRSSSYFVQSFGVPQDPRSGPGSQCYSVPRAPTFGQAGNAGDPKPSDGRRKLCFKRAAPSASGHTPLNPDTFSVQWYGKGGMKWSELLPAMKGWMVKRRCLVARKGPQLMKDMKRDLREILQLRFSQTQSHNEGKCDEFFRGEVCDEEINVYSVTGAIVQEEEWRRELGGDHTFTEGWSKKDCEEDLKAFCKSRRMD
ncbi:hypothetical protein NDU88_005855 [Pleurodeles waltl]|uniref:Uncharacterized protein n=1 Tax=Pleurodeles waltl TaxID=8319 RepID=A0AAV7WCP4_PLEWA|nr:hypothetical protein NDU88_005855 [Pleurodeles waltl]